MGQEIIYVMMCITLSIPEDMKTSYATRAR